MSGDIRSYLPQDANEAAVRLAEMHDSSKEFSAAQALQNSPELIGGLDQYLAALQAQQRAVSKKTAKPSTPHALQRKRK